MSVLLLTMDYMILYLISHNLIYINKEKIKWKKERR